MAIIDIERDVVVVRIVYDGPPLSGKTTSVHTLANILDKHNTIFSPQEEPLDKTRYFDWMEYCGGFFKGYSISCQIVSVPGQLSLAERRHFLLRTADVVIFVLDASESNTEITKVYFKDLQRIIAQQEDHLIGVIIQANKQDKPKALSCAQIKQTLFQDYPEIKVVESTAISGKGVRETFVLAVRQALERTEELMSKGQLNHGQPEVASGEELFNQLQNNLILEPTASQPKSTSTVESTPATINAPKETTLTTQKNPDQTKVTLNTTAESETHLAEANQEGLPTDAESSMSFEQLDNHEDLSSLEPAEDSSQSPLTIPLLPTTENDIALKKPFYEPSNLFEQLEEIGEDDEWDEGIIEHLPEIETLTTEEEDNFFKWLEENEFPEELEEDLEELDSFDETDEVTFPVYVQFIEPTLFFEDLDNNNTTVTDIDTPSPLPEDLTHLTVDNDNSETTESAETKLATTEPIIHVEEVTKSLDVPKQLSSDEEPISSYEDSNEKEPTQQGAETAEPKEKPVLFEDLDEDKPSQQEAEITEIESRSEDTTESSPLPTAEMTKKPPISFEELVTQAESYSPPETTATLSESPLLPDKNTPIQWIWPPLAGQALLTRIFDLSINTEQEADGTWVIKAANEWFGFSKAEWLYADTQIAQQILHDQISMHLQCSPILSEQRCIVIATDDQNWRLWQIVHREPTLAASLVTAAQARPIDKLALELFRCVSHYAEVYLRCIHYPSFLNLKLEHIGMTAEQQFVYLGIVEPQTSQLTQAKLTDYIKQVVTEKMIKTIAIQEVAAIANQLEQIDGFEQHYLIEILVQLFRQLPDNN